MKIPLLLFGLAALALSVNAPDGFHIWPAAQLKMATKTMQPKMNAQKLAIQQLGNFGNHTVMLAHRESSGEAELHQTQVDVFVVETGEATLVVGGAMVDPKTTAPNELRGPSINGGERHRLFPGDLVHIPANVPHQVLLENGSKQVTYALVKVDAK